MRFFTWAAAAAVAAAAESEDALAGETELSVVFVNTSPKPVELVWIGPADVVSMVRLPRLDAAVSFDWRRPHPGLLPSPRSLPAVASSFFSATAARAGYIEAERRRHGDEHLRWPRICVAQARVERLLAWRVRRGREHGRVRVPDVDFFAPGASAHAWSEGSARVGLCGGGEDVCGRHQLRERARVRR